MDWNSNITTIARETIKILGLLYVEPQSVIVFDIDETVINLDGTPIDQMMVVYNYSKMIGLKPIFITGREHNDATVTFTQKQLEFIGATGYESIFFRPAQEMNQFLYKSNARKEIIRRGNTVVMSIGDMPWDIGKHGGIGILVPKKSDYGKGIRRIFPTVEHTPVSVDRTLASTTSSDDSDETVTTSTSASESSVVGDQSKVIESSLKNSYDRFK